MGARLGRYVVLKHLASGGMADVLLARGDGIEGFERHVVIKRIRPEFARDQRFIRMFLDEARIAATLHHQNIVHVHDIGEAGGEYFIAMEYVHGEDARRLLAWASRQRIFVPVLHAVAIVSALAAGLHYAHERCGSDRQPLNIVHRDVTPSNILIGYDGAIKIADFGIATASAHPETRAGGLRGKISYMSPEQCVGAPVDRRTDVYALGAVLYELSTTRRMIRGDSDYTKMEQIVRGQIEPPQNVRPDLPAGLVEIIMRALSTDRDQRYATADELRIALHKFAWESRFTAPTSSIAEYLRRQFGERLEPWLELGDAAADGADIPVPVDVPMASSWGEHAYSAGPNQRAYVSFHSRQLGGLPAEAVAVGTGPQRRASTVGTEPQGLSSTQGTASDRPADSPGSPASSAAPDSPDSANAPASSAAPAAPSAAPWRAGFPVRTAVRIAAVPLAAAAVWLGASWSRSAPEPLAPGHAPSTVAEVRSLPPTQHARAPAVTAAPTEGMAPLSAARLVPAEPAAPTAARAGASRESAQYAWAAASQGARAPEPEPALAPPPPSEPPSRAGAQPRGETPRPTPPGSRPPRAPDSVTVAIASTPAGAQVILGGSVLGKTPFRGSLPRRDRDVALVLRLAGYDDRTVVIHTDQAVVRRFALKRPAAPGPGPDRDQSVNPFAN